MTPTDKFYYVQTEIVVSNQETRLLDYVVKAGNEAEAKLRAQVFIPMGGKIADVFELVFFNGVALAEFERIGN